MQPEELIQELDGASGRMMLVVGFPEGTAVIERAGPDRWEKLCDAHVHGGRAVGVITFEADGTFAVRVLTPFTVEAARPYLEKIAGEIAASVRAEKARSN